MGKEILYVCIRTAHLCKSELIATERVRERMGGELKGSSLKGKGSGCKAHLSESSERANYTLGLPHGFAES